MTRYLITGLLVILLIGNNEMFILVTNFLLGVLLLFKILNNKMITYKILLLNLVSWMSTLVVVFTPATGARQKHYPEGGDILLSLKGSILSSGMFIFKSLIEFPYVFLYATLLIFLYRIAVKRRENVFILNPILLLLGAYLAFLLVFFVPLYATGHIAVNSGRIGNVVHIFFLILLFLNIVNLSNYLSRHKMKFKVPHVIFPGLVVGFLAAVVFSQNYDYLILDLKGEELTKYEKQVEQRLALLKEANGIVWVDRIKGTRLLRYYDVTNDSTSWQNHCYVEMIKYRYGSNIEDVLLGTEQNVRKK